MPAFTDEDKKIIEEYENKMKIEISNRRMQQSRPIELNIAYARYLKMLNRCDHWLELRSSTTRCSPLTGLPSLRDFSRLRVSSFSVHDFFL